MSKFLYLQDFHIKGKNPEYRIDNYYQSMLEKLDEVLSIAKLHKVDFIIDGGDLLNGETIANTIVDDILDRAELCNIPWHLLYGNHSMLHGHIENSKTTSLAHMIRRSKIMNHLTSIKDKKFQIDSKEFSYGVEEDIKKDGLIHKCKNKTSIMVCHALITLKPFHPSVSHVVAKDIKTNYDIIFVAHYHQGWGIKEINKTQFINISCIGRMKKDEMNIIPKVAILDTETKKIDVIELKSAKPYKEVFNLELIEKKKNTDNNLDVFVKSLENTELQSIDTLGLVLEVGRNTGVDKIVIDAITKKIEEIPDEY